MTRQQSRAILRDYQRRGVEAVCRSAKNGQRRIVVCQPVGSGKTEVMAELCRLARYPLAIVPLIDLMRQARDRLELRLGEGCDIEQGGNYAESIEGLRRRVIVGSRDSLLSGGRYKAKAYERVSLVLVDECHVGMTPRMEEMLRWYEDRGATIVGFSATPYKGKGKALRYWPRPQVVYSLMEGIHDGYLVGPTCFLSEAKSFDLTLVDEVADEWQQREQLAAVLAAEHFAQEVSSLVLSTYKHRPSVVYAGSRRQAVLLTEVFDRYGARVSLIHCRQNPIERKANMDAFLAGDTKIIVNVGILGYGWDHPELRNIYMAAPTRSLSRYEQRLGRGTRPLPGVIHPEMTRDERLAAIAASDKPTFNLYDITDSSRSHQLLSALDVLDAKRRTAKRRARLQSMLSMEGVDATAAIKEADALDLADLEAKAAEMIEKRKRLIVGVTFDHDTRDLFSEPETKKRRGWRMLYGKYKGQRLDSIPDGYLSWVMESTRKESPLKQAIRSELVRRRKEQHKAAN